MLYASPYASVLLLLSNHETLHDCASEFCSVHVHGVRASDAVCAPCDAACELRNLLQTDKCKVLHKFETDIDGELPLNRGDVIVTTAWDQ